jgi:hypothetical protein
MPTYIMLSTAGVLRSAITGRTFRRHVAEGGTVYPPHPLMSAPVRP